LENVIQKGNKRNQAQFQKFKVAFLLQRRFPAAAMPQDSTLWDAQWDGHMRHIVLSFPAVQEHNLFEALTAAGCTNLVKAKALVESCSSLESVPEELQCRFRQAVVSSNLNEGESWWAQSACT
jgi:hypothetical protein